MGIEVKDAIINKDSFEKNFTNEGGVEGTTRFLKNICGMWLLEQCRREWSAAGNDYSYPELIAAAEAAPVKDRSLHLSIPGEQVQGQGLGPRLNKSVSPILLR